MHRGRLGVEVKLDRRRLFGAGCRGEIGLLLESEDGGKEGRGHAFDGGVVVAGQVVETAALHRNAILRTFELGLQHLKTGAGLQVRIALDHDQQPGEGGGKLSLRLLKLGELGGIGGSGVGTQLHLADRRARVGDFRQGGLLKIGGAGHGVDEVGDEVGAPLVDILHLRPLRVHCLGPVDETVVGADGRDDHNDHQERDGSKDAKNSFAHTWNLAAERAQTQAVRRYYAGRKWYKTVGKKKAGHGRLTADRGWT